MFSVMLDGMGAYVPYVGASLHFDRYIDSHLFHISMNGFHFPTWVPVDSIRFTWNGIYRIQKQLFHSFPWCKNNPSL